MIVEYKKKIKLLCQKNEKSTKRKKEIKKIEKLKFGNME